MIRSQKADAPERYASALEALVKVTPILATLTAGAWVLIEFFSYRAKQERLALTLAHPQAILGELDIAGKSAFNIKTKPKLNIEPLAPDRIDDKMRKYLVIWEVGAINRGSREIQVTKHVAEMFPGRQTKELSGEFISEEVNFPERGDSEGSAFVQRTELERREFSASDRRGKGTNDRRGKGSG